MEIFCRAEEGNNRKSKKTRSIFLKRSYEIFTKNTLFKALRFIFKGKKVW